MINKMNQSFFSAVLRPVGFLVFCLCLVGASFCLAQEALEGEDQFIETTKERYGFDQWPTSGARDGLPLDSLEFDGYQRESIDFQPDAPVVFRYADERSPRFLIELKVFDAPAEAHELLAIYLSYISSPNLIPSNSEMGIAAGDIGFTGRAPAGALAWIAFLRGNIFVRICNLDARIDPQPPMRRLAERIDGIILDQPLVEKDKKVSRPVFELRCESRPMCAAGEIIPLNLHLQNPASEAAALTWVVEGPGQGYVQKDASGKFRLHTTKEGKIRLYCHFLGARGTAVTESLDLTVQKVR